MPKQEPPTNFELRQIQSLADYQFGKGAGIILFPDNITIERSRATKRIKFVHKNNERICSYRVKDGHLVPSLFGAEMIHSKRYGLTVTVHPDAEPFIRDGKSLFAKHVLEANSDISVKDEVILINSEGDFLGIGTAKLPSLFMKEMNRGVAVDTRKGKKK